MEDAPSGVLAAKQAGMQVVLVPNEIEKDTANPAFTEENRNATLVIHSLLDFKPELFGLPSFGD